MHPKPPRLPLVLGILLAGGLTACNSDGSGPNSGLGETFRADNFRRSSDTNGTQTRRDVNRLYTQPALPSIANRGN